MAAGKSRTPLPGILRRIDPQAVGQGWRLRRARRIPFGVAGVGRGQDGGPLPLDRGPLAPMDDRRRQPPEAAVPVLRVVPVEKLPQPPPRRRDAGCSSQPYLTRSRRCSVSANCGGKTVVVGVTAPSVLTEAVRGRLRTDPAALCRSVPVTGRP